MGVKGFTLHFWFVSSRVQKKRQASSLRLHTPSQFEANLNHVTVAGSSYKVFVRMRNFILTVVPPVVPWPLAESTRANPKHASVWEKWENAEFGFILDARPCRYFLLVVNARVCYVT